MKDNDTGGASTATALDAFGGANNPATMVLASNQWAIGLDWFSPDRSAQRTGGAAFGLDGSADSGSQNFFIPEFALNDMLRPELSVGVTVDGNGGLNTDDPGGSFLRPAPAVRRPAPTTCSAATGA